MAECEIQHDGDTSSADASWYVTEEPLSRAADFSTDLFWWIFHLAVEVAQKPGSPRTRYSFRNFKISSKN
jgi:hypothetical protein